MGGIHVSRVYDHDPRPDGEAFFVERLWPRGMRRGEIPLDRWCKEVAPSTELRRWFGHDPAKWPEFRRRYEAELDERRDSWQPLIEAATKGELTLLYSSRDREHNNAVVLREYLLRHLRHR